MIEILKQEPFYSKCGTTKYKVQWRGTWENDQEIIDAVDGSGGNYGGFIHIKAQDDDVYTGVVHVWYD